MTCKDIEQQLVPCLLGDLDAKQAEIVHRHIEQCGGCRARMKEIEHTLELLQGALAATTPDSRHLEPARRETVLKSASRGLSTFPSFVPILRIAAGLIMCVGLGALIIILTRDHTKHTTAYRKGPSEIQISYVRGKTSPGKSANATTATPEKEFPRVRVSPADTTTASTDLGTQDGTSTMMLPPPRRTIMLERPSHTSPEPSAPGVTETPPATHDAIASATSTRARRVKTSEIADKLHFSVGAEPDKKENSATAPSQSDAQAKGSEVNSIELTARSIAKGRLPPPDQVNIQDFIAYAQAAIPPVVSDTKGSSSRRSAYFKLMVSARSFAEILKTGKSSTGMDYDDIRDALDDLRRDYPKNGQLKKLSGLVVRAQSIAEGSGGM